MTQILRRIPSLDGLRAISIALVLFGHSGVTTGFPLDSRIATYFDLGTLGVRIFFIISGFLITEILLSELQASSKINLFRFYLRRILRIVPPYYLLIAVVVILSTWNYIELRPGDVFHALTFTTNYHYPDRSWFLNHAWSLCVEEQFYLIWPAILLIFGLRRSSLACIGFVVVAPFYRVALYANGEDAAIVNTFGCVGDAIASGCLLALFREKLSASPTYKRILSSRWMIGIPVLVFLASGANDRPNLNYFFCITFMNIGISMLLDWCVTYHSGRMGKVLNYAPITVVGKLSYSIYLWQQLFLVPHSSAALATFPLNLIGVAVASALSYYMIERPSFRSRRYLDGLFADGRQNKVVTS